MKERSPNDECEVMLGWAKAGLQPIIWSNDIKYLFSAHFSQLRAEADERTALAAAWKKTQNSRNSPNFEPGTV